MRSSVRLEITGKAAFLQMSSKPPAFKLLASMTNEDIGKTVD